MIVAPCSSAEDEPDDIGVLVAELELELGGGGNARVPSEFEPGGGNTRVSAHGGGNARVGLGGGNARAVRRVGKVKISFSSC